MKCVSEYVEHYKIVLGLLNSWGMIFEFVNFAMVTQTCEFGVFAFENFIFEIVSYFLIWLVNKLVAFCSFQGTKQTKYED